MIPEVGHFALIVAFCVTLVQASMPLMGARTGNSAWMALARPAAWVQFILVSFSYVCLTVAFVVSDFSVAYAAHNSNTALPLMYRIAAVWGAQRDRCCYGC